MTPSRYFKIKEVFIQYRHTALVILKIAGWFVHKLFKKESCGGAMIHCGGFILSVMYCLLKKHFLFLFGLSSVNKPIYNNM